jgi:hypothetical protein
MKLNIELNEKDVQIKLDEFLGERISSISNDYIETKVKEVVDKKIDRLGIERIIQQVAKMLFVEKFGDPTRSYNNNYEDILKNEAYKLIEQKLKG